MEYCENHPFPKGERQKCNSLSSPLACREDFQWDHLENLTGIFQSWHLPENNVMRSHPFQCGQLGTPWWERRKGSCVGIALPSPLVWVHEFINVFHGPNVGPSGRESQPEACQKTWAHRQVRTKEETSLHDLQSVQPNRGTSTMPSVQWQDSQLSTSAGLRESEVTLRPIHWNSLAPVPLSHCKFQLHQEGSIRRAASEGGEECQGEVNHSFSQRGQGPSH